jgi:protein gp37
MATKTKLIRLGPSGIEYLDYVWNFYSGCRHIQQGKCPDIGCWAEELVGRFSKGDDPHYPNGFSPTFYPEAFLSPLALKGDCLAARNRGGSARIGVCFMGDLFGDWVDPEKMVFIEGPAGKLGMKPKEKIFDVIRRCPQHQFIFLTKNVRGMQAWGKFPDNCEVGFTATNQKEFVSRLVELGQVEAKVKWCSIEPLLDWSTEFRSDTWGLLDWVALGALTGTKKKIFELAKIYPALTPWPLGGKSNKWGLMPPVSWLKNIVEQCDAAGTRVFLKDNLFSWLTDYDFSPHGDYDHDLFFETMSGLRQSCGPRQALAEGARPVEVPDLVREPVNADAEFYPEPERQILSDEVPAATFPDHPVMPNQPVRFSDEELLNGGLS